MPPRMGNMVLADKKLHVLCGFNSCNNLDLFLTLELSKVVRYTIRLQYNLDWNAKKELNGF